ncbi:MAG: CBS domain-containing protein [Thermodesulfovibrionales bacterium]|nr:CBS domain-containing protein [Thermodesulfovibrionales bacterium]
MLTVGELMRRDVVTISAVATIRDAFVEMKKKRVRLLVTEKRYPLDAYGIITFAEIAKALVVEGGNMDILNVFDIASKPAVQVSENLGVKYAVKLMINLGLRCILVVDNNDLKGILTFSDAVSYLVESTEKEKK